MSAQDTTDVNLLLLTNMAHWRATAQSVSIYQLIEGEPRASVKLSKGFNQLIPNMVNEVGFSIRLTQSWCYHIPHNGGFACQQATSRSTAGHLGPSDDNTQVLGNCLKTTASQ
jgi:hypothetical protein